MRRSIAGLVVLYALGASPLAAQAPSAEPVFEILGLEEWTPEMVAEAVARFAPDVSLRDAACAVILRDSVGFAQAAVETYRFPEGTWTSLSLVEPEHAERVRVRVYPDSAADRREWARIRGILEEDPLAMDALQDYAVLTGASDSVWGEAVEASSLALRDEIGRIAREHGDSAALWTLANDRNQQNRAIAPLILAQFPDRESTWHALMSAQRGPSDWPSQFSKMALIAISVGAARPVDWRPVTADLEYVMSGTNLFAYLDVLAVLARTSVGLDVGRRLIAVESPLLLDNLESLNPHRAAIVRRFLRQAGGVDYGDDTGRWAEWLRAAQSRPRGADARLERAIDALRTHADTSGVAGLAAAIHVDGARAWSGGFGWADYAARVPMSDSSVSRIGSISKSVAAVATMLLVDGGRLDLDAPISTYLPDYPKPQGDRMTMRQIMSHTAGIRHYNGDEFLSDIRYDDVFAPLAVFAADPLLSEPGTEYSYSTYGYTVVSAVTERAAGREWTRLMREEIFEPLGLRTMQPEWADSVIPNLAAFHFLPRDRWPVATHVDNSNKWAGGGLVSDVRDLAAFGQAMADGRLLSDAARTEMWTKQTPEGEESYGLGWRVGEIAGHRAYSHSGGSVGATAMLIVLPDDDIVVAILGNTSGVGHAGIAGRVARILLGADTE